MLHLVGQLLIQISYARKHKHKNLEGDYFLSRFNVQEFLAEISQKFVLVFHNKTYLNFICIPSLNGVPVCPLHHISNHITYSMEQSSSWEANRFSASQEILRILWNPKIH